MACSNGCIDLSGTNYSWTFEADITEDRAVESATDPWQQYLTANSDRLSHFGHRMSLFLQTLVFRGICSVSRNIAKNVLALG